MSNPTPNAIVTGAANGLGRAIAVRLARDGWRIALADVDSDGCRQTLDLVAAVGGQGRVEPLDVSQPAAWEALRERLRKDWPRLDLLVNNAGVCGAGEVGQFSLDDWHWLLNVNLYGVVYGCHTMVDWLKANPRGGHIINTASLAAFISAPSMPAYNVAKSAVVSLSETLHSELAPHGIGVSVLCPAFVPTGLLDRGRFPNEAHRTMANWYTKRSKLTVDHVADSAIRAMHRKQLYVVEGRKARLLWRLKRWLPKTLLRIIAAGYHRQLAAPPHE